MAELFSDAMGAEGTYEGTYIGMIDHNSTLIARGLGGNIPRRGMNGKLREEQAATSLPFDLPWTQIATLGGIAVAVLSWMAAWRQASPTAGALNADCRLTRTPWRLAPFPRAARHERASGNVAPFHS